MLRSYKHPIDKQLNIETLFGLVLCASLFSSIFFSSSTFAHTASLSTSGDIVLDLIPNPSGDTTGVGKDTLTISTTCTAGYNLDISSSSSSASLYLNGDTSNTASNDNVVVSPVSGTKALSTNEWGYSTTSSSISGNFTGLSPTSSTLATSSTSATNQSLDVYYGVKLSNTAKPGSYTMPVESSVPGAIVYYLTMDPICAVVDIAYDGNNADAGTMGAVGTGIIHTNVREGDTVNLIASNFSRSGYGFAGWSTDENAGTKLVDNDTTNNPVVYGPQESITIPVGFLDHDTDNDGVVKLYAVWIPSQGNLQGWIGCSSLDTTTYDSTTGALDLTKNSVTALTDQRDNDTYAVARLADGNCWMIENLRLDAEATRGNNINDPTITNESLAQGYGKSTTYGNFSGLADAESTNFSNSTTANSLYYSGTQSGTATINIGTSDYPSSRMPRYNHENTNSRASNPTTNSNAMYSYGNYYTWYAAIADLTYNGTKNQSTTGTSLCPTGWHLPTGGLAYTSGNTGGVNVTGDTSTFREFYNLGYETMDEVKTAYEDTPNSGYAYYSANTTNTAGKTATAAFRSFPNNFLYSGYFGSSSAGGRGSYGYYWSSTVEGIWTAGSGTEHSDSYTLGLSSSSVAPGTRHVETYGGESIRCVSNDPEIYTLTYNANGGSGAPASQSITANGAATFTVSNTTPTRSGYTFTGWMDEKGNEAQPGGTFRTKDPNAVLYAIWTNNSCNPTATTIGTGNTSTDTVCLQDVKPSMKSSLPTADSATGTYTLIDARDGQSYTVAKLADGNLWLTKNLNYGSGNDTLLTPYDTDLPAGIIFKAPASTTAFETANNDTTYVSPKILTDSTYGGYYSFAAAIASTIAYSSSGQNVTTSICPKGWDLPTRTMYDNLRTTSGNTTFAKMSAAPYSFINAGYRDGTSFTSQTSALRLWTSTNYSSPYAYYTTAYSTASFSSNYKRYGESVRCVASNGTATIHYNANGGTGAMADQTGDINSMSNIRSNGFAAPYHKQFREWCTNANGTGTCVAPGANVSAVGLTDSNTVNLYAQWDDVYVFTFVNTALTANNTRTKKVVVGSSGTVAPSFSWSRTGYKLVGWDTVTNDASDSSGTVVYTNSQSITPTGDMTFYTVWRPIYAIAYDINTTDSNAAGTMGNQTNIAEGDSVTLLASNFSRTGYGFAGWSLAPNAATNTSAKIYGPQETISAPNYTTYGNNGIVTMYAVWVQSAGSIQNTTTVSSVCNSLTTAPTDGTANISSVSALTDQRDNQTYAIAKLADGKCWMIENLRLESTAEHNSDGTLAQGYHSSFAGLATAESANFSDSTTANSLYYSGTQSGTATINIGTSNSPAYRMPRYNHENTNSRASNPTTNSNAMYSYGNYYTWHAAIADLTYNVTNNQSTTGTSLCPTGWHLPTGGAAYASGDTSGVNVTGNTSTFREFYNLGYETMDEVKTAYEDTPNNGYAYYSANTTNTAGKTATAAFRSFPNNFLYSGRFYSSSAYDRGSYGLYWSSTAYDSLYSYALRLRSSIVFPGTSYDSKYYGFSIRCVSGS